MQATRSGGDRHHWPISAVAATLVCGLLAVTLPASGVSARSNLTSEQVAAEIVRVQGIADETAARWATAQLESEDLAADLAAAEERLAASSAQYAELEDDLADIAVDRFTSASSQPMLILFDNPAEEMQANALRNMALDVGATDLDYIDALRSDLADDRANVQALEVRNEQLTADLAARGAELETQLAELTKLREQLQDEEVKRAYEEQLAKQRREQADREARAAAAAAAVPAAPPKGAGVQATAPAASSAAAPSLAADPAPDPEPAPVVVKVSGGWACPVAGPNAFGDTWGAARSGGRKHQGVDMMSPGGTPVVAVVAGSVTMKTTSLGGNSIWLTGVDGAKYFYAHLSAWEGGSRSVGAGDVIGYVGHTGNTTANHLHFEIHPGGGAAINPTPTVRQYC